MNVGRTNFPHQPTRSFPSSRELQRDVECDYLLHQECIRMLVVALKGNASSLQPPIILEQTCSWHGGNELRSGKLLKVDFDAIV